MGWTQISGCASKPHRLAATKNRRGGHTKSPPHSFVDEFQLPATRPFLFLSRLLLCLAPYSGADPGTSKTTAVYPRCSRIRSFPPPLGRLFGKPLSAALALPHRGAIPIRMHT